MQSQRRRVHHHENTKGRKAMPRAAKNDLYQELFISRECLDLLGIKDHPLAHKRFGDATREDLAVASDMHMQAARIAEGRARLCVRELRRRTKGE
jgi:hypothetical protein